MGDEMRKRKPPRYPGQMLNKIPCPKRRKGVERSYERIANRVLLRNSMIKKVLLIWALLGSACYAQAINSDERAFAHAQREANLQASRERVGHFLGIAPGCRFAGVGSSTSIARPNHCTTRKYKLVARAYAVGRSGKVYWSAHYR